MSTLYSIVPFTKLEEMGRMELDCFLDSFDLSFPPHAEQSRDPTLLEIEKALEVFSEPEFVVEYFPNDIESELLPWSSVTVRQPNSPFWYMDINVLEKPLDKNTPCHIYIQGKPELNYRVIEILAHSCGPLLSIVECEYDAVIFHYKSGQQDPKPSYCKGHYFFSRSDQTS